MNNSGSNVENFNALIKDIYLFEEKRNISRLYLDFQRVKNQFLCFNDCFKLTDFIQKLSELPVKHLGIEENNGYIQEKLLLISLIDEYYKLRPEWINYLFGNTGEVFLNKRFTKLIKLCLEIEEVEGNNLGLESYIFFRMDILIRRPIITISEFKDGLAIVLKGKFNTYREKFIGLFKEFYEQLKYKGEYNVCLNCGYLESSNYKHIFCKSSKFKKEELDTKKWIIKESVYKNYTSVGLIERDTFDKLKSEEFDVQLYPQIEKEGDLKVVVANKTFYIDCKSYSNVVELAETLKEEKYDNRLIVVPDIYYQEQKEYIDVLIKEKHISSSLKGRFFNLQMLTDYLKGERKKHINEQ